jgi:bromodomain-containing factor 1
VLTYTSTDPRDDQIAELERHLAIVSQQLASMKSSKKRKAERQMSRSSSSKMTKPAAGTKEKSSSKYSRPSKPSGEKRKRPVKSKSEDDLLPEFTFEQKKDLSESINNLNGDQLNTVVQIIQSSMPNLDGVCLLSF